MMVQAEQLVARLGTFVDGSLSEFRCAAVGRIRRRRLRGSAQDGTVADATSMMAQATMQPKPTRLPVFGLPCGFQVAAADGEFVLETGVPLSSGVALGGQRSGPTARLAPGVKFVVTEVWTVAQPEVGGDDEKPAGVDLATRSGSSKSLARFLKAGCVTRLLIREDPSRNVPAGWTSLNSDVDLSVMLCNLGAKPPCDFHANGTQDCREREQLTIDYSRLCTSIASTPRLAVLMDKHTPA